MRAEILTIGDELCRGEVVDTNSSFLAETLWDLGITVAWMTSCRDERADMRQALLRASERAEVVLVSGGLGPTEDDLTVDVLAEVTGSSAIVHEPSLARMKERYAQANFDMTPNNLRQVRVLANASAFDNPVGAAPGFETRLDQAAIFVLPGVPWELRAIFAQSVETRLRELSASAEKIARGVYRVFGMGESHIDHALAGLMETTPGGTVHYQVKFPETLVKLVVRAADADVAKTRLEACGRELRERLGERCYAEGADTSLSQVLGQALRARGATLAVAESCTGGLLGALLSEPAGASAYFLGGVITYSNDAKVKELGVRAQTLTAFGAVSPETVIEMAQGARERWGSTYAAALSGVAGPGGGTPDKPVGTMHVAVAGPRGVRHKHYTMSFGRERTRLLAAYWALAMTLREVHS